MSALALRDVTARHGLLTAVHEVSFAVAPGQVLALVGANGAGKTTLLRGVAGAHPLTSGRVELDGNDVTRLSAHRRVRRGLALVPEGRRLFGELTVGENLAVAACAGRAGEWDADTVIDAFPQLKDLRTRAAGSLSGGQQQAVAIARALMTNPVVLLLDEVSLGLSPAAIEGVYTSLQRLRSCSVTVVLVEQDLARAMAYADHLVCLLEGRVVLQGACRDLTREQVTRAYFGLHAAPAEGSP